MPQIPPDFPMEPIWFAVFFVAMWVVVCALLARLSGWRDLAIRFRATTEVAGEKFGLSSGSMGSSNWFPVGYRNCLFVTVSDSGLGLSLIFPFRLFSPSLFISWDHIESVAEGRIWMVNCTMIKVRGTSTKISLRGKVAQSAMQTYMRIKNPL